MVVTPQLYFLRVSLKSILTSFHLSLFLLRVSEVLGLKVSNSNVLISKAMDLELEGDVNLPSLLKIDTMSH